MNIVSDADMCDCEPTNLSEEELYTAANSPCVAITVDLLNTYKRPIECYLRYSLWNNIGSNQAELENAVTLLNTFISQKIADPNNCDGLESLILIRSLVDKIIKKGVCL